jgi:hypothetical protein
LDATGLPAEGHEWELDMGQLLEEWRGDKLIRNAHVNGARFIDVGRFEADSYPEYEHDSNEDSVENGGEEGVNNEEGVNMSQYNQNVGRPRRRILQQRQVGG